jgi:hypothetical protein
MCDDTPVTDPHGVRRAGGGAVPSVRAARRRGRFRSAVDTEHQTIRAVLEEENE